MFILYGYFDFIFFGGILLFFIIYVILFINIIVYQIIYNVNKEKFYLYLWLLYIFVLVLGDQLLDIYVIWNIFFQI